MRFTFFFRTFILLIATCIAGSPRTAFSDSLEPMPSPVTAPPDHAGTLLLGGAYLGLSIGTLMVFPPDNWSGKNAPRVEQFKRSWSELPTLDDGDPWTTNYVGHPLMGSVLYVFARRNHHPPGLAFLSAAVASTAWEYAIEGWFEQPSVSDLLVTPSAGALIGEARWQARQALLANGTPGPLGQLGLLLADPIAELEVLYHMGFPASAPATVSDAHAELIWTPGEVRLVMTF